MILISAIYIIGAIIIDRRDSREHKNYLKKLLDEIPPLKERVASSASTDKKTRFKFKKIQWDLHEYEQKIKKLLKK